MKICLLLLFSLPAQAADWGRLFYSPEERNSASIRYDGRLETRHGKTYWINGLQTRAAPPAAVRPGENWNPHSGQTRTPAIQIQVQR